MEDRRMQLTMKNMLIGVVALFLVAFLSLSLLTSAIKLSSPSLIQLKGSKEDIKVTPNIAWLPAWLFSATVSPRVPLTLSMASSQLVLSPQSEWGFATTYTINLRFAWKQISTVEVIGPALSTSVDVLELNHQSVEDNYPLADQLPYEDDAVYIAYDSQKILLVKVKKPIKDVNTYVKNLALQMHWDLTGHTIITQ